MLIVENGQPLMVVTPFKDYKESTRSLSPTVASAGFVQAAEEVNREIKAFASDDFFTSFETERQATETPPGSGFYREPL